MAVSEDLRIRLVRKVASGMSRRQAAALFEVSASSAVRYVRRYEDEGTVAVKPRPSRKRRLDPYGEDILRWIKEMDPSRKSGGALHRLHCFCLEFDGACEVQRRVPTDWIIEPVDVSGYGSFSLAS